jgi:hypothetical protein
MRQQAIRFKPETGNEEQVAHRNNTAFQDPVLTDGSSHQCFKRTDQKGE